MLGSAGRGQVIGPGGAEGPEAALSLVADEGGEEGSVAGFWDVAGDGRRRLPFASSVVAGDPRGTSRDEPDASPGGSSAPAEGGTWFEPGLLPLLAVPLAVAAPGPGPDTVA